MKMYSDVPGLRISGKDSEVKTTRQFLTGTILKKYKKRRINYIKKSQGVWFRLKDSLFNQAAGRLM